MYVQVSYKKQFAFGIIFLIIVLSAVEGLLRIDNYFNNKCYYMTSNIYPDLDYGTQKQMCNDYRDIAYLTGIDRQILPNQENKTIHINNFGMRGPDITQDKPNDTYRIIIIGGSTTYGSGSTSDKTTIPGFLQEKIDNSGIDQKVQVINAGIMGSTSIEEVHRIKNDLVNFDPDMIIIYDGVNDAGISWERYSDHTNWEVKPEKKILTFFQIYLPEYKTPLNAVAFIERIKAGISGDNNLFPHQPVGRETFYISEHMLERASLWHNRIKDACEFGNENGFKTMVIFQPMLGTGNKPLVEYEHSYYLAVGGEKNTEVYDIFSNGLLGLENYCYKVEDFRNIFDNVPEFVYFDIAHLADYGNEVVSQRIFEIIKPTILDTEV